MPTSVSSDNALLQLLLDQLRSLILSESSSPDIERLAHDIAMITDETAAKRPGMGFRVFIHKDTSLLLGEEKGIQARILAVRLLGRLSSTPAVDLLVQALDDPSWEVREAAVQEVGKQKNSEGINPLIAKCRDLSWHVRRSTAWALGLCGGARVVAPLTLLLSDSDRDVRLSAIEALGYCGDLDAAKPLIVLLADEEAQTRNVAARSLSNLGSLAVEVLLDAFPRLQKKVKGRVIRILGDIGDSRAVELLIATLSDAEHDLRQSAARALGKFQDAQLVEPLIALLKDRYVSVRRAAIQSLGLLGDTRAVEPLLRILDDDNHTVRRDAAVALMRIGVSEDLIPLVEEAYDIASPSALRRASEEEPRAINVWIGDLPPGRSLQIGQIYRLNFNVNIPQPNALARAYGIEDYMGTLPTAQQTAQIQVLILTDDFIIHGDDLLVLIVPRTGESNTIGLSVEPERNGTGIIRAFFTSNNRLIQQMRLTLEVGGRQNHIAEHRIVRSGLEIDSVFRRLPRQTIAQREQVSLTIVKRDASYQFILNHSGRVMRAMLNLSEAHITDLIRRAREELKQIVYTEKYSAYIYQLEDTTLSKEICSDTIKQLAKLGFYLYESLFFAPGNSPDAHNMGRVLRQLSRLNLLNIQIVPEHFVFPWALLYDEEILDTSNINPSAFWGFKHVIWVAPEFNNSATINFEPHIVIKDTLELSFICDTNIDRKLPKAVVQDQYAFLQAQPDVIVSEHPNRQDLYNLLGNSFSNTQLLYFYCHAQSYLPGERGGVDDSKVTVTDGSVTLYDLKSSVPLSSPPLRQAPLVFLNACQSAELSPYLYDGLVPYLVARGVRGVIGTEVDTPVYFAAEFAQEFLARFISGELSLGDLLLEMRRKYLFEKNNVLGLVYALYSSGDLSVKWKP